MTAAATHDPPYLVSPTSESDNLFLSAIPTPSTPSPAGPGRKTNSRSTLSEIRCTHEKCKFSKATFKRASDLKRHQLKHEGNTFDCSAVGCNRRGIKAFYRPDKLREHICRAHGHEAQCCCPSQGCQFGPVPLLFLALHIGRFDHLSDVYYTWSRLFSGPFCPLRPCRKPLEDNIKLTDHLRQNHSERDRIAQSSSMYAASLDPATCESICPVCGERPGNLAVSFGHLFLEHMVDKDHFQEWLTVVNDNRANKAIPNITIMDFVTSDLWSAPRSPLGTDVLCPRCSNYTTQNFWPALSEHKEMEIISPELVANREAVLRLFPVLGFHSVFEDLKNHRT